MGFEASFPIHTFPCFCVSEVEKALEMDDQKPIDKKQKTKKHKKNNNKAEKKEKFQPTFSQEGKIERADSKTSTLKKLGLNRIGKKPDLPPPEPPRPSSSDSEVSSDTQTSPRKTPLQATMSQPQPMADIIHSISNRPSLRSIGSSRTVDENLQSPHATDHRQPGRPPNPSAKSVVRRTQSHDGTLENENNPLPRPRHRPPLPPPPEALQGATQPRSLSVSSNGFSTHDSSGEEQKPRPIPRSRPKEGTLSKEDQRLSDHSGSHQGGPNFISPRRDESRQPQPHPFSTKPNRPLPRAPKTFDEENVGNGLTKSTPPGRPGPPSHKTTPSGYRPNPSSMRPPPAPKPQIPQKPAVPKKPSSALGDWKSDTTLLPKVREVFELAEKGHEKVQEITALSYSRPPDSESYVMEVIQEFKDIYHQVMDCSSGLTSSLSPQARFSVRRNINTLEMRFGEMDSLSNSVGVNPSSTDIEKIAKLAGSLISTMDELCSSLKGKSK